MTLVDAVHRRRIRLWIARQREIYGGVMFTDYEVGYLAAVRELERWLDLHTLD